MLGVIADEGLEVGPAGDHRRDQHGVDAVGLGCIDLAAHLVEIAGQAGDVAGVADGAGDCRYAVGEGGVGLIGEAVVVLDEVDAASGEALGELGEAGWWEALGFQGGACQGAAEGVGALAQAVDAVVGAGEDTLRRLARPG